MVAPLPRPRAGGDLVSTVYTALRDEIVGGSYQVGDKMPSQAQLIKRFSVSQTVVREAIAALRADGLAMSRQGAGVFVTKPEALRHEQLIHIDPAKISTILEILELRIAVESEAAALAAMRRSPAQEEEIYFRYKEFAERMVAGTSTAAADQAFHAAIAAATNNPQFAGYMATLGQAVIPRAVLGLDKDEASQSAYLAEVHREHGAIVEAISAADPQTARSKMRTHLEGSLARYRAAQRQ